MVENSALVGNLGFEGTAEAFGSRPRHTRGHARGLRRVSGTLRADRARRVAIRG